MIPYGNGSRVIVAPRLIEIMRCHDTSVPSPHKSAVRTMADNFFVEQLSWLADDWRQHDCKVITNRINQGASKMPNSTKTIWVKNNLSDTELQELDDSYPNLETIESMLSEAIEHGAKLTITWDRKAECYVCYLNQGDYACSGRSGSTLDALVIALYKLVLCDWQLSKHAKSSNGGYTRG